jgi:hypothetical protein
MPAKKTTKKAAKKTAGTKKKAAKPAAKKVTNKPAKKKADVKQSKKKAVANKKAPEKKKVVAKPKPVEKKNVPMPQAPPIAAIKPAVPEKAVPPPPVNTPEPEPVSTEPKEMMECPHCQGVGKCTYGDTYDKDHHQGLFQERMLTSCGDCLEGAGKARNSKKIVACRFCKGTGQVEKK